MNDKTFYYYHDRRTEKIISIILLCYIVAYILWCVFSARYGLFISVPALLLLQFTYNRKYIISDDKLMIRSGYEKLYTQTKNIGFEEITGITPRLNRSGKITEIRVDYLKDGYDSFEVIQIRHAEELYHALEERLQLDHSAIFASSANK